jgi:acetyltransferase
MADLDALFRPKGIAIIGASNRPLTIGNRVLAYLISYGYKGPVHPVNPKDNMVMDRPAYKSILDVPDPIDLVHIIVRNTMVPKMLEDCAEKGVKVAIVNASGFREMGPEGVKLENEMVALAKKLGIRLFGPNCQGVMNSDPDVSLYSNFTFAKMTQGHVSVVAQGGGVAEVINNYFGMNGVGQRMYASNGNACDISIPEIIEYYGEDEQTHVIVLHLESFADPDEFLRRVGPVAGKKPVLALKSGSTPEGAKAVSSHTGGLMAVDTFTDVLFNKCGVLRFDSLSALCEAAEAFNGQPVPKGNRIGMVTNAGSPAIIVTDEAIKAGLAVPDLAEATKVFLKEKLQAIASIANPIDMMATASGTEFSVSLQALLTDPNIDAAVVCFMTPFFVETLGIADAICEQAKKTDKTLIAVAMTNPDEKPEWRQTIERVRAAGVPVYYFPEVASNVLYNMNRYRLLRDRPQETAPRFPVDIDGANAIVQTATVGEDGFMDAEQVSKILACYGIPLVAEKRVRDLEEAKNAAADLGYPVVLKAESRRLVHKTDAGGVALALADPKALERAYLAMNDKFSQFSDLSFLLQRHLDDGLEVIVGGAPAAEDHRMIMFGLGGIHVEVFKDVTFKLAPINKIEAREMLQSIHSAALLDGVRGQVGVDKQALVDVLLRVSQLLTDHPAIEELDLNPLISYPEGTSPVAVDARIKVRQ